MTKVFCILLVFTFIAGCKPKEDLLTTANREKITMNMSLDEVIKLVGPANEKEEDKGGLVKHRWINERKWLEISFINGQVNTIKYSPELMTEEQKNQFEKLANSQIKFIKTN